MKPLDRDKIITLCLRLLENNKKMCRMPLSYFIEVLERAGKNWLNPDYHYRKKAIQVLAFITGQSPPLIEEEMNIGFKLWNKTFFTKSWKRKWVYLTHWMDLCP